MEAKEICIFSQKIEKSLGDLLKKGSYTCSTLIKLDDVTCLRKYDNLIFYGCKDKTIRAWDLTTNQCIITLETQQNFVDCLYKEDNLLFSGLRNGIIQVWDLTTNQFTALRGHQDRVVSLRKAGNRLFSGSSDNTIKVWDLTTNQCTTTFPNFERGIAQTDNIVFAGYRQVIKMWDLNTNQFFANFGEHKDTVRCLHIKDHLLFSGSDDGIVKIWDLGSARCIATLAEKIDDGDEYTGIVCFHVEGDLLFSGSWNGAIKVWDLTTNQCLATLAGHGYPIAFLHKKGNRLFSGANDGTIKVWDFLIPPPEDKNLYEGYKNALGKGLQTLWERVKKTYYNN